MILSINSRLLLAASIVLAAFLGVTGFALERAYRTSAENALKDRLQGYTIALIAAAEPDQDGEVHLANALPVPRFFTTGSGLYGQISSNDGSYRWVSPSIADKRIAFPGGLARATDRYHYLTSSDGESLFSYSIGVTWDEATRTREGYTFSVAESLTEFDQQVNDFRKTLWGWLGAVVVVLLAVQGTILRWGLSPLRRVSDDLAGIEAGRHTQLEGRYPAELSGLTDNLNALVKSEREHLERYRNTLGDLAHSLKTPLALLRGAVESQNNESHLRPLIQEQVGRMSQIIEYQLQRAATSGRTALVVPVSIYETAQKIVSAMDKVYADKHVNTILRIDNSTMFFGDESDLMEILGNLIDNACKWSRQMVMISASHAVDDGSRRAGVMITIEDDGPGIRPQMATQVVQRGVRDDINVEGHGIGLAVVQDIVDAYHGQFSIGSSELGGAKLTIRFPGVD